jgi:hypothetical protein
MIDLSTVEIVTSSPHCEVTLTVRNQLKVGYEFRVHSEGDLKIVAVSSSGAERAGARAERAWLATKRRRWMPPRLSSALLLDAVSEGQMYRRYFRC